MIEPMSKDDRAYHESWAEYPTMTKFIGPNGDGHRGLIVKTFRDATVAQILGKTGEFFEELVLVREYDEDKWPVVIDYTFECSDCGEGNERQCENCTDLTGESDG